MPTKEQLDTLWKEKLGETWFETEKTWFKDQPQQWKRFGAGNTNLVYINEAGQILKIPINPEANTVACEEALWRKINPKEAEQVSTLQLNGRIGLICPLILERKRLLNQVRKSLRSLVGSRPNLQIISSFLC